jgi:Tol biopolymer transport system component
MNSDGSARTRLTHGDAYDFDPAWSPDGAKIVFASTRDDPNPVTCWPNCNAEIYVMNADGGNQMRLTSDPAYDSTPSWSPDGTKIAFSSYRNSPSPRIFLMGADGSNQTDLKVYGTYPAWSPDGKKIAFGDGNIWVTGPVVTVRAAPLPGVSLQT